MCMRRKALAITMLHDLTIIARAVVVLECRLIAAKARGSRENIGAPLGVIISIRYLLKRSATVSI